MAKFHCAGFVPVWPSACGGTVSPGGVSLSLEEGFLFSSSPGLHPDHRSTALLDHTASVAPAPPKLGRETMQALVESIKEIMCSELA